MASTKKTKKPLLQTKKTVKTISDVTVIKKTAPKVTPSVVTKSTPAKKTVEKVMTKKMTKPVTQTVAKPEPKKPILKATVKTVSVAPQTAKTQPKKTTKPVTQTVAKPEPKKPILKATVKTVSVAPQTAKTQPKKTTKPLTQTVAKPEPKKPILKATVKTVSVAPQTAKTQPKKTTKPVTQTVAKPEPKKPILKATVKTVSVAPQTAKTQPKKTTKPLTQTVAKPEPKKQVTPKTKPAPSPAVKNDKINVIALPVKPKAKITDTAIDQDELLVQKIFMNEDTDLLPKKLAKKKNKLKLLELDKLTDEDIEPDLSELPDIDESDLQGIDISILSSSLLSDKNRNAKTAFAKDASLLASIKNDTMKVYMQDIGQISLVSKEEEVDLAAQIKDISDLGHDSARNTLILANLRLVVKIAHDFKGLGLPLLDLISEGNIGLMRAVEKFDPAKGAKFSSYAAWWIKQSMRRALANQSRTIRIPVQSAGKINKIKTARMKLTEELGRDPTDAEIAEFLTFSERTVAGLRLSDPRTFSIHDPIQQGEDGEFQDIIPDRGAMTPDRILGDIESVERLRGLLTQLDEREQQIITMRFGLTASGRRPLTLEEVSQEIGRTRERVRQIQNQALAKLRELLWDEAGFVNE